MSYEQLTIYTIAHLLMVAGEAWDRLSTSKISLIPGAKLILSPLARQRTFESSSTVFKFSTQRVSTGPSRTSHLQLVWTSSTWSLSRVLSVSVVVSSLDTLAVGGCRKRAKNYRLSKNYGLQLKRG